MPRRASTAGRARLRFARHDAGRAGRAGRRGAARAPARHRVGIQPLDATCSAAWSRQPRASGSATSSTSACSSRCAWCDTAFSVPAGKSARLAQPLAVDLASSQPIKLIDVSAQPKNDSGGAGAVSTAADYLRFSQMLLNGGQLDGVRILSRTTVELMTSDHLGTRIAAPTTPGRAPARHARLHVRARLRGAPGRRRRRRARLGRRVHVGGLRRHLLLGRSEGAAHRRLHEPGARARSAPTIAS